MDLDIDTALVVSDAATNLLIWVMPMPMVWRMPVELEEEASCCGDIVDWVDV